MQRVRRLASVAVVAILAGAGLAGCRSAPDVAVYFGQSAAFGVADVERIYDDARTRLTAARDAAGQSAEQAGASAAAAGPVEVPFTGPDVVATLVGHDLATRLARAQNVTLPADLPLDRAGQSIGLPGDAEYVRLWTETRLLFDQLMEKAAAAQTTDADLRAVYQVFEDTGELQPGTTFESFKAQVPPQAMQVLGRAVTVRNDVQRELDQLDVRVNPRYESAEISVYAEPGPNNQTLSLISVPLATSNIAPVSDAA